MFSYWNILILKGAGIPPLGIHLVPPPPHILNIVPSHIAWNTMYISNYQWMLASKKYSQISGRTDLCRVGWRDNRV